MKKSNKTISLDGIELLQVVNHKNDSPEHYHDTFCISLIESRTEAVKTGEGAFSTEKGHISINNPYEIHSNPLVEDSLGNSFTTIYLSPDLVDFILQKKGVHFQHRQKVQTKQIELFTEIKENLAKQNILLLEKNLSNLLNSFDTQPKSIHKDITHSNRKWAELMLLIESRLEKKISLDFLSMHMRMDKFSFSKEFRSRFGLSPINYVLMKKIFRAKSLIRKHTNLTQLAYQLEFTDQAHFSKYFKKFVGLSPRAYKHQING